MICKLITKPERRLTAADALKHKWIKRMVKEENQTGVIKQLNVSNFKRFQKTQKLKQVALMAIAVQSDPRELDHLTQIFRALDRNGDGTISFDELEGGLGGIEKPDELMAILRAADTDGSGTINYTGK